MLSVEEMIGELSMMTEVRLSTFSSFLVALNPMIRKKLQSMVFDLTPEFAAVSRDYQQLFVHMDSALAAAPTVTQSSIEETKATISRPEQTLHKCVVESYTYPQVLTYLAHCIVPVKSLIGHRS